MKTAEIRDAYLSFFAGYDHRIVPSSTLVPNNDPTLLFTNAGMNQFKDPLLGRSDPGYKRAASSQRCVRAGGKHNDLENVGYTARHLTFFEMLGNFSFGDYFKEETISWAWEFVSDVLQLPEEKIWVTVHPTDDDARDLWTRKIGLRPERVVDLEENFWTMGDTGPCGPCTELFYDHGPEVAGGPPGSPDEDGDRYVEFWNLVFPQFDRSEDGELTPLPQPGVDTGMGLERMATVKQGVHSVYETDMFRSILLRAGQFAGINSEAEILANPSLRVISDHIRSSAFLVSDGIVPGNEDRAYVLRRIIRRALRHGYKLNIREPFFHKLVGVLVDQMGEAYPELADRQDDIADVLASEEERFGETLNQGMELLRGELKNIKQGETIPGEAVFKLYDTYGFPADLTADIGREQGFAVDMAGFEEAMEAQRARGRASTSFSASLGQKVRVPEKVEFKGYGESSHEGKVLGLFDASGDPVDTLTEGTSGVVVLDQTTFYAEQGGQVGDQGTLKSAGCEFRVDDTQLTGEQHMHIGTVIAGTIEKDVTLEASVDDDRREKIRRNHSATHLLHAALRAVLGDHVQQKGSLVNDEKLRFDFSHNQPVTPGELDAIERMVNREIRRNSEVRTELMTYDEAIEAGAMALFGEKYGDDVRVLTMGDGYSVELCGGTHARRTGDIALMKITAETGIAAGVRRVEAVSGAAAEDFVRQQQGLLDGVATELKSAAGDLLERVKSLVDENRQLRKSVDELTQKLAADKGSDLLTQAVDMGAAKFVAAKVEGDGKAMMQTLDQLRSQMESCVVVLAQEQKGKVNLVVGVSKNLTAEIEAPDVMDAVSPHVGARGGGRPDLARAGGGDNPAGLDAAFTAAETLVKERLG